MSKRLSENCETCPLVERVAALEAQLARQQETISRQQEEIARLKKNSRNSSKPPSSDIVNPPKPERKDGAKRKIGGQPGHKKYERAPFTPDEIDETKELRLERCPNCQGHVILEKGVPPLVQQTVDLPEKPVLITEYRRFFYRCPGCGGYHFAPLPEGVIEDQLFGLRLMALIAWMKGASHTSYRCLQTFFSDVLRVDVSIGHLTKTVMRVSEAAAAPYKELKDHVPKEPVLNIDETGFKENKKKRWIWVFASKLWTLFVVAKTRSREVLKSVLTETFSGTIVSDFFPAYVKIADAKHQYCLAHLIRDIKFLTTLPSRIAKGCGERLLQEFKRLFELWYEQDRWRKKAWAREIEGVQARIRKVIHEPNLKGDAKRLANRIETKWDALFLFLKDSNVPPTNNDAERPLRFPAIDRRVTQGCRGEKGARWSERIWTILDTCAKQNRSAWQFLLDCLEAHNTNSPHPSLLPSEP